MTFTLSDEDIKRCREIAIGANGLIMDIVKAVAEQTEISAASILSDRKARPIVQARWLICYLAHVEQDHSLPTIARALKYKDHTGVHYGVVQELKRRGFQTVAEARAAGTTYIASEANICQDEGGGEVREKPQPAISSERRSPHERNTTAKADILQPHCSAGV